MSLSAKKKRRRKVVMKARARLLRQAVPRRAGSRPSERSARGVFWPLTGSRQGQLAAEQLRKIFPKNKGGYPTDEQLQAVADELNSDLGKFKLDSPIRQAHFFGQIKQESPLLDGAAESLNYSPEGLKATFGYYRKHPAEALADGRLEERSSDGTRRVLRKANEEVIANKVYMGPDGNTDLGNLQPGDGWLFRGRGVHQTTGRSNYREFTKAHPRYWEDTVDFLANPELLEKMPYNLRSAVAFWLDKGCWKKADGGINDAAIDAVTQIINAGEVRKHMAGKYKTDENPVLKRRKYVHLAYAALT